MSDSKFWENIGTILVIGRSRTELKEMKFLLLSLGKVVDLLYMLVMHIH